MNFHGIENWDDAYTNVKYIPDGGSYPAKWQMRAEDFRSTLPPGVSAQLDLTYGTGQRCKFDLFRPANPKGLLVFVHGGYWMRFDRKDWSHLAAGALARGFAVAMPSYSLTPFATITGIVTEVEQAIAAAASEVAGPIILAGHSAGGHLVTRAVCEDSTVVPRILERIQLVVSISGLHDLRPLLRTQMNETLRLSVREAELQSPSLLAPRAATRLICWVGAGERPEFIRQSRLLANVWTGLGAQTRLVEESGRHHFDVIEALQDKDSALTDSLFSIGI